MVSVSEIPMPKESTVSLRSLRVLSAVASKGTFAAAADQLGLTQSAISLQIKNLEDELGVQLFERTGRSPRLNMNGRYAVERVQEILRIYDEMKARLSPSDGVRGVLTLGVVPTVITGSLPPALGRLRARYQEMHVKLVSGLSIELVRQVEEGDLDAALTTEPPYLVPAHYEWIPYDEEPFYVVAPKGVGTHNVTELFERFPFVRFDKLAWAGAIVDRELLARQIEPREVMEFDSLEAALALVAEGLGIAVVPLSTARYTRVADHFTLTPFGSPQLTRRMGMYQKRQHPRLALTGAILDELRQPHP
ncbi:LysR family transcriptional regulator [Geomonas limicola]|uniref:LysR family transcriptional regulator n=1 Tax=Geomonas limicola TaxID=2740186 RepID=UPI001FE86C44|nr:LysR family transcriptional regulator [Geomonas limicola]